MQIIYFLISLFIGALLVLLFGFLYDKIAKLFVNKPLKPVLKPKIKPVIRLARTAEKAPLKQSFTVEIKGSKEAKELNASNFKELLSGYFIAVDYLLELWIQNKFNLIITDDLIRHYGKNKDLNGFIRYRRISEIYIKASTSSKHRTGVLIHEIAHLRAEKDAQQKKIHITSHGKEFKRHMRILFAPLLEDKTYFKRHKELSYHLTYEARKYSPAKDMCV